MRYFPGNKINLCSYGDTKNEKGKYVFLLFTLTTLKHTIMLNNSLQTVSKPSSPPAV